MKQALKAAVIAAGFAALAMAQKPKSQKEIDAYMAIQNATTADARIAAVDTFISKFADSELKAWALNVAGETAAAKRDNAKAIFYYEQSLKADPKGYTAVTANVMLGAVLAQSTRETDLDKDEKLAKAEKYAKDGLALIGTAPKPALYQDAQYETVKKDDAAQAHVDLGMIATIQKKTDVAVAEYKTAVESAATPDPITMIRLAAAYTESGKPADALSVLEKVYATPNLNPQIKNVADSEKARAEKLRAAK
jgi:tetratricopeptide (TPR) repeat protein